ncbi:hypothetical protein HMPREF3190_01671 [Umbribacter vaginalis]|nr:hypothetical protein HMPREF3190_01671 [Coriobacteriales bacterium DNF00809]
MNMGTRGRRGECGNAGMLGRRRNVHRFHAFAQNIYTDEPALF